MTDNHNNAKNGDGEEETMSVPLADWCSLCGRGYHPNLEIEIGDEPHNDVYGWAHVQCKLDHDRAFVEAFSDD